RVLKNKIYLAPSYFFVNLDLIFRIYKIKHYKTMMVVTGAAGFIGSCLISKLNKENFNYIIAVDDFSNPEKNKNLEGKKIQEKVDRKDFFSWLKKNHQ